MTIRKKWIITAGLIAIISIAVNSVVLSVLTSQYFNGYLDSSYQNSCNKIVSYLTQQLSGENVTQEQLNTDLGTFVGDSISGIKVFNTAGVLIAGADEDNDMMSDAGMGKKHEMMDKKKAPHEASDHFKITKKQTELGEVQIFRSTRSGNTDAAKMFQKSLAGNSLISMGIVVILAFFLGLIMSKKVSSDLILTSEMAQNIDLGKKEQIPFSTTREIRIIQQSLRSLETRLKLKQKARKALVDEMVHQTRTPLTILKMHLEGIEDGIIEAEPDEFRICENQIDNLSDIIINISSLIDSGADENLVKIEKFDLAGLIRQILNGMRPQFRKKGIELQMLKDEHTEIRSDKYRLGQTIYNILTNSYKFTPTDGTVSVDYRIEKGKVLIEIADTGCGISKEEKNRIFDAYYGRSSDTGKAGDGIGLFIARENMELVQGSIEVESEEGKGSLFRLIFPDTSVETKAEK